MTKQAVLVLTGHDSLAVEAARKTGFPVFRTTPSDYAGDIVVKKEGKNPFLGNDLLLYLINRQVTKLFLLSDNAEDAAFVAGYTADLGIATTWVSAESAKGVVSKTDADTAASFLGTASSVTDLADWKSRMDLAHLRHNYTAGSLSPEEVIEHAYSVILADPQYKAVWITLFEKESVLAYARELSTKYPDPARRPPLFGIPFSAKDSWDVKGVETTGACPAYAFTAPEDAPAVRQLLDAGAILLGKVNLDQLATGLVGMRSPYGQPASTYSPLHVSGGSSSGSCVSVAAGHVTFSLATDTAGSSRVPAAFNGIVGLKPTRGTIPATGLIPCCLSHDAPAVEALSVDDAAEVWNVLFNIVSDETEPFSKLARPPWALSSTHLLGSSFTFAFPSRQSESRKLATDEYNDLFDLAIEKFKAVGGSPVEIDYTLFEDAGRLLYEGSFVAQRVSGIQEWWDAHPEPTDGSPDVLLPEIRQIYSKAATSFNATRAFQDIVDQNKLERRMVHEFTSKKIDVLIVPTAPLHPTKAEYTADPIALNHRLGKFTHFANILDMIGLSVPAGLTKEGLPFGVSLLGPSFSDGLVLEVARRFEAGKKA